MPRGYFHLYRKFQAHPFWTEKRIFSKAEAWIDLLWEAQDEEKPQQINLRQRVLYRNYGESLKSIRTWAKRWGWGEAKVYRYLKLLKKMSQIETVSETVLTRISILNYKEYNMPKKKSETVLKQKRNTYKTVLTTNKNDKNVKKKDTTNIYPEWLDMNLWADYKKHRIEIGKEMSKQAETLNITKLTGIMKQGFTQKKIINTVIELGWRGIYAPPTNNRNRTKLENAPRYKSVEEVVKERGF